MYSMLVIINYGFDRKGLMQIIVFHCAHPNAVVVLNFLSGSIGINFPVKMCYAYILIKNMKNDNVKDGIIHILTHERDI